MERRYGRAQFLRDALALGLPLHQAFSRTALRRQRDLLMRTHHPDRGGSDARAREINEIHERMIKWLDKRHKPRAQPSLDKADSSLSGAAKKDQAPKLPNKAAAAALWAVTFAASGYIAAKRAKRR